MEQLNHFKFIGVQLNLRIFQDPTPIDGRFFAW
jgi:hypothetical protein